MLRIACLADIHGYLIEPVNADLALIAGDLCPDGTFIEQYDWFYEKFARWLYEWDCPVVYIAGNHDRFIQNYPENLFPGTERGRYLQDSVYLPFLNDNAREDYKFLSVTGVPWTLPYGNYAFMATETEIGLCLPMKTDILLTHGPINGVADIGWKGEHAGSVSIEGWAMIAKPRLIVHGHLHEGYGVYKLPFTTVVSCSIMDEHMNPSREPIVVDFDELDNHSFLS